MSAKISLLWINVNLVEHSFYITIESNRFFTEATENAAETVDQVGSLKKMSVERFPLNSALASNTTWILFGFCGWYTPWCGMYQTRPLSRWSSSSGTLSAFPSSSWWRSYNDPDIRYLFSGSWPFALLFFLAEPVIYLTIHRSQMFRGSLRTILWFSSGSFYAFR